jgi:hypothetical protein
MPRTGHTEHGRGTARPATCVIWWPMGHRRSQARGSQAR